MSMPHNEDKSYYRTKSPGQRSHLRSGRPKRKFQWIHLPFNNPRWVKMIVDSLSKTYVKDYSGLLRNGNWHNGNRMRHAQSHVPSVKSGCGFVGLKTEEHSMRRGLIATTPPHFYLYLPYLNFDTYISMVQRRQLLSRRLSHGRTYPVPRDIAERENLELRVIWGEIGNEYPLNLRRTLDQYGQPWLKDTSARDDSQLLYKLTRETRVASNPPKDSPLTSFDAARYKKTGKPTGESVFMQPMDELEDNLEHSLLNGKVLMVDQLWLWAVDTTVMTCFTERESDPIEGTLFQAANLRNSIYNQFSGVRCENDLDFAALVTLQAVMILLEQTSHPDLEVFRIFEEAIGIMAERMTSSLRRFRIQESTQLMPITDASAEEAEKKRISIEKLQERQLEEAERMNREDTSVLLELRDADDELTTLRNLFIEQTAIVEAMRENYLKPELVEITVNGVVFLNRALARLGEYRKQVSDLMDRIDTIRKDYQTLLEMMQRVDDVRFSRLQTELARTQNRTLMIFTSFTVIFLPLSFFTTLFGMNTQEWGGGNNISLKVIGAISLPASALLISTSLIIAFSPRVQLFIKNIFKPFKLLFQAWWPKLHAAPWRRRHRQPISKPDREDVYDFWESVGSAQMGDYIIPAANRKRR